MYKVKHIPTGLYYQPVTSSGTNLGKKGKIYETTSSCLSGGCNYIILDIKKNLLHIEILQVFLKLNMV